jgi:hypothetical protein
MRALILAAMMAAVLAVPTAALATIPPDEPQLIDRVCTSRVTQNDATVLGQLHTLIQCPGGTSAGGFTQAKLAMLNGTGGFPKCNNLNDVIRIHYPFAVGMTFTSPELGECLRGGTVVFSRPL